ncbi:SDR family oxidoreductase [Candidatus Riflebacteria bacterium]
MDPKPGKRLLITGASGFLGWNLLNIACHQWDCYGLYHRNQLSHSQAAMQKVDITDYLAIKNIVNTINPDAIIHCAAIANAGFCQKNPEQSRRVNVAAAINIADLCNDLNIPCVFCSTDLVFDGLNPPYTEDSPVSPVSIYGEQKVEAEEDMKRRCGSVIICRLPLMFGRASPVSGCFLQNMLKDFEAGKTLTLFKDEFRTPAEAKVVAAGLLLALAKEPGIINLGGSERISRCDFGYLVREIFSLSKGGIKPCLQKDVKSPYSRAKDVSLDISKARSLGYKPQSLRFELKTMQSA